MPEGPVDGEGRGRAGERKAAGAAAGKAAEARQELRLLDGPVSKAKAGYVEAKKAFFSYELQVCGSH